MNKVKTSKPERDLLAEAMEMARQTLTPEEFNVACQEALKAREIATTKTTKGTKY